MSLTFLVPGNTSFDPSHLLLATFPPSLVTIQLNWVT